MQNTISNDILSASGAQDANGALDDDRVAIDADCNAIDDDHVVISSLIVETAREYTHSIADQLALIEGVEVHGIEDYKIVVTIEAPTVDDSADTASSFIGITGVLGINLIYCNFEDDPTLYPDGL